MEKEHKIIEKKYPEPIVGSLIINNEGKILLAKSKKWNKKYTVFGGHVEYKETLEDAVIRESKEEAGIDVTIVDKLSFDQSISAKDCYKDKHFVFMDFLCKFEGDDKEIRLNDEYENEFKWFSVEDALKLDLPHGTRRIIEAYEEYRKKTDHFESWKRCAADFENYKKRQAGNMKDVIAYSNTNLILEILPVLDNFYASTDHVPEDQKKSPWVVGIMHIQKQLEKVLEDNGVSKIVVEEGDKFDPSIHEAVEDKDANKEKSKNIIKKILMKGYKIENRVIRAARVTVE